MMTIVLTGATGFLGRRILEMLLERGHKVRAICRRPAPELATIGAEVYLGNISGTDDLSPAFQNACGLIHCAAQSGVWGSLSSFMEANFFSTVKLLNWAQLNSLGWLLYTSSPSVVHSGVPLCGVDETVPYGENPHFAYPYSKMLAERTALSFNGPNLKVAALRPHLIWGPGDPHFLPRFLKKARAGKLYLIKGQAALVDATYIDNAAWAHILAAEKFMSGAVNLGGKAYFIGQGEPLLVKDLVDKLLAAAAPGEGLKVRAQLPWALGFAASRILEWAWKKFKISGEPPLTKFVFEELTLPHWFCLKAAQNDFAYEPLVSMTEGLNRLRDFSISNK